MLFPETLRQACRKTDWQVHAWCLMLNHFHRLRQETTMALQWIADRLKTGVWTHVSNRLTM
jgi:REP element-mobilizing transposase RayT